jgi:hypothetical protein
LCGSLAVPGFDRPAGLVARQALDLGYTEQTASAFGRTAAGKTWMTREEARVVRSGREIDLVRS